MDSILLIVNTLAMIGFVVVALTLKAYLPSYLKEKGRNLATKEDIGGITQQIEQIRTQHALEIERLKADLQCEVTQHGLVNEKASEVLLNFFEACLIMLCEKMRTDLGDLPIDDGQSLRDYQTSTDQLFTNIYTSYHKLFLFVYDEELLVSAGKLLNSAMEVRRVFRKGFFSVKLALFEEIEALKSGNRDDIEAKVNVSDAKSKAYNVEMEPHLKKMEVAFGEYLQALNGYFERLGRKTKLESPNLEG